MNPLIATARKEFHADILKGILTISSQDIPSNADKSNKLSIKIAQGVIKNFKVAKRRKIAGQTSGTQFEESIKIFLEKTFPFMENLRPGIWSIERFGNRSKSQISSFAQYRHLAEINELIKDNDSLITALGSDYLISPDILISREPYTDEFINTPYYLVDDTISTLSDIRYNHNELPVLHASVSAKWTVRSDRAQNCRTEAFNLIKNRKGRLPHVVVVTAEPLPSRISSIALGTGDIDCVYHFALYELKQAIKEADADDALELLNILIEGNRLKDISDLPLDLCV